MQALTLDIIRKLPKAELHCHLGMLCRRSNPFIKMKQFSEYIFIDINHDTL
jgi:adenosine deaminase